MEKYDHAKKLANIKAITGRAKAAAAKRQARRANFKRKKSAD